MAISCHIPAKNKHSQHTGVVIYQQNALVTTMLSPTPKNSISRNPPSDWPRDSWENWTPGARKEEMKIRNSWGWEEMVEIWMLVRTNVGVHLQSFFYNKCHKGLQKCPKISPRNQLNLHSGKNESTLIEREKKKRNLKGGLETIDDAEISLLPELQCFISDSQLTRDAALHLGLEEPQPTPSHWARS